MTKYSNMVEEFEKKLYQKRQKIKESIENIKNKTNYEKIQKDIENVKEKKTKTQLETQLKNIEFILNPYILKENQLDTHISLWLGFLKKELLCPENNEKCLHCNKKEKYEKDNLGIVSLKNPLYSSGKLKYCISCFEERKHHLLQIENLKTEFEKYKNNG